MNAASLAARWYEPVLGGLLGEMRAQTAAQCPPAGRILDCCCGPGGLARVLVRPACASGGASPRLSACAAPPASCGPDCAADSARDGAAGKRRSVTGIDLCPAMLRQARRNAPEAAFLQADACRLPFAAASFAAAAMCLALHAMPAATADAALEELRRVARRVIVADYCLAERNLYLPGAGLAHAVEWLVGGEHYRCYRRFMAAGALEGLLHRHGVQVRERVHVLGGAVLVAVLA